MFCATLITWGKIYSLKIGGCLQQVLQVNPKDRERERKEIPAKGCGSSICMVGSNKYVRTSNVELFELC